MNEFPGSCHCEALTVIYRTQRRPGDFPIRRCLCSFCRLHGARTTTDPDGLLTLCGRPRLYTFGLATAEFMLCPRCGVYLGARLTTDEGQFATLNVNILEIAGDLTQEAQGVTYEGESREERIARRAGRWTPFQSQAGSHRDI